MGGNPLKNHQMCEPHGMYTQVNICCFCIFDIFYICLFGLQMRNSLCLSLTLTVDNLSFVSNQCDFRFMFHVIHAHMSKECSIIGK